MYQRTEHIIFGDQRSVGLRPLTLAKEKKPAYGNIMRRRIGGIQTIYLS